jgi:hypothetical protein
MAKNESNAKHATPFSAARGPITGGGDNGTHMATIVGITALQEFYKNDSANPFPPVAYIWLTF